MRMRILVYILLTVAAILSGCREVRITTRIFNDGTCERIIEAKGDSAEIADPGLALPVSPVWTIRDDSTNPRPELSADSSWTILRKPKNRDEVEYTARRRFRNAAAMEAVLKTMGRDSLRLEYRFRLQRRFRWFSTVYRYSETVLPVNPFLRVPVSDYLSEDEIRFYSADEDTMDLDEKVDAWGEAAVFEAFHQLLLHRIRERPAADLTADLLERKKDSLRTALDWADIEGEENEAVIEACVRALGLMRTETLDETFQEVLENIHRKTEFLMGIVLTDFVFKAEMPGLIIGTNAPAVEGNRAVWDPEGTPFLFRPFEMRVESRRLNVWTLWISGALLIVAILMMTGVLLKRGQAADG